MSSAGFKLYFKKRKSRVTGYSLIMSYRSLTVLPDNSPDDRITFPCYWQINCSAVFKTSLYYGIIYFFNPALKRGGGIRVFSGGAKSGGIPVKSVDRSESDAGIICGKAVS